MAKLKVKKGDNVVVISGKDRGKTGKITQIIPEKNRAVVEGVNIITKHQKPKGNKDKGGIIKKSAPMQISNLMVVCSACGKATRVGKTDVSGKLSRVCKKCGAGLDKEYVKAVKKELKKKDNIAEKESAVQDKKLKKDEILNESIEVQKTEKTEKQKVAKKPEAKIEKPKSENTSESKSGVNAVKSAVKKPVNDNLKKVTKTQAGRTTTIRKSNNRGK